MTTIPHVFDAGDAPTLVITWGIDLVPAVPGAFITWHSERDLETGTEASATVPMGYTLERLQTLHLELGEVIRQLQKMAPAAWQ